jgi:DNA adenine methylase
MMRPIIQYPGNKWRLRGPILARLARCEGWRQFPEPFVGGGAICLAMIDAHPQQPVWINDLDISVYYLWVGMRDHPELLLH